MAQLLICGDARLDLSTPVVMGVLNITPDSFSDGGFFIAAIPANGNSNDGNIKESNFDYTDANNSILIDKAVIRARSMLSAGAKIIDVGGESTRPGAKDVTEQHELARVIPVIEAIKSELSCIISIDTSKAAVMDAAVRAGASMINDVNALLSPGCLEVAVKHQVGICLMHMQGQPRTMQQSPHYNNVVKDVRGFLLARSKACIDAGIAKESVVIDPGFGFGKTLQHNLQLVQHLEFMTAGDFPVLVGMSRKSTIGAILDKPVNERLSGSLAMVAIMASKGASIFRVHDVAETVDVLKICAAVNNSGTDRKTTETPLPV